MNYTIDYAWLTHPGLCRKLNQDNLICGREYLPLPKEGDPAVGPSFGRIGPDPPVLFGVFDGMGGEEHGEIAAHLAAQTAAELSLRAPPLEALSTLCRTANESICSYAASHGIGSTGTTAALLLFSAEEVSLCDLGDSKIFLYDGAQLKQISEDHVSVGVFGRKPPLSQNLGIPPSELTLRPYFARGAYHDGDLYLICSDGLTDMVPLETLEALLAHSPFAELPDALLQAALEGGGKDNITFLLCKIQKERTKRKHMLFRKREENHGTHRDI